MSDVLQNLGVGQGNGEGIRQSEVPSGEHELHLLRHGKGRWTRLAFRYI